MSRNRKIISNPGSENAVKMGCTCPVMDNAYGKGCGWKDKRGNPMFWRTSGCPLHDVKRDKEDNGDN